MNQEWIKAIDKTPDGDCQCLVVRSGFIELLTYNGFHKCWDDCAGNDFECEIQDVSCWMYAPKAPINAN